MVSKRTDNQEPISYQALLDENHSLQRELNNLRTRLKEGERLRHAEEELRESEERYRTLFMNMTEGFLLVEIICNKDGKPYDYLFLEVNPAFELHTGMKKEQIGRTVLEVFPDVNHKLVEKYLEIAFTDKSKYFEVFSQTLQKHLDVYVFSPEKGKIAIIFRDITEKKQMEEQTRQRAEETEAVMEVAPVAIWIGHDPQCDNITGNQMANEFYGAKTGENVSANITPVRRFFHKGCELAADELLMQKAAFKDIDVRNEEIDVLLPGGEWRALLGPASPLHDVNGSVRGSVAAFMDITQRKKAENKLKETLDNLEELVKQRTAELEKSYILLKKSESSLAEAQKMAHVGNWEWDIAADKAYWSEEMYRIFKRDPQKLAPSLDEYLSYIHPDDLDYYCKVNDYTTNVRTFGLDFRIVLDNGEERTLHIKSDFIYNDGNIPVRVKGIVQDITESKKAEEALRDSEARFKAYLENSAVIAWMKDEEGRHTFMSDNYEKRVGVRFEDWCGKTDFELWPREIAEKLHENDLAVLKSGKHIEIVEEARSPDGSTSWWLNSKFPFVDSSGKKYVGGLGVDITELKRVEESLRKSREQYKTLFNSISEGFANYKAIYDEQGIICDLLLLEINPAGARILGIEREIGKTVRELLPGIKDDWFEAFNRVDQKGESVRFESFGNITGKWYVTQIDRVKKGQFAVVFRDITEKKEAQETLAKIETARKKEIHHRIKNNLQVISSLLDLAAEKFKNKNQLESAEVIEAFKESQNRVMSIAFIHKELHEGEGLEKLNFSLYLEKLAENLFRTYSVGHSGISLDLDLEDNVFFDTDVAVPLGMIVNELISNSFKYAFPGRDKGTIRIKLLSEGVTNEPNNKEELKRKDTKYTLIVADNGIGIPDNINLENTDTLGLQLVSILVDQLDGKIKVGRGQGTEFNICFNTRDNGN